MEPPLVIVQTGLMMLYRMDKIRHARVKHTLHGSKTLIGLEDKDNATQDALTIAITTHESSLFVNDSLEMVNIWSSSSIIKSLRFLPL